jgi:c-di-GMP-related signal transduction protein
MCMASATQISNGTERVRSGAKDAVHFVVRQPILDLRGRVHAFKLLFREEPLRLETDVADRKSLLSIAAFGLEKPSQLKKITGALAAFVECTEEMLSPQLAEALPASLAILEISSSIEPSAAVIASCHGLKTLGFRLALRDFNCGADRKSLVDLADYIEVDISRTDSDTRQDLCAQMQDKRPAMLANGVETQAEYRQARDEGFSLFAGSYYYQPAATRNRRPPANQLLRIELLKGLQQQPMDLHKMSQLVMRDGPLAFHLLRFVNSPLCGLRQEVQSIDTALLTLGEDTFRRIATLAIASQFNGNQPAEILCMAIIRGRFCEVAGTSCGLDPFNQYLLGLLSLLPAMQGLPMSEIAPTLPLSLEIREALMGTKCQARSVLGWLESYERGDWNACKAAVLANGLKQQELARCYVEAIEWAEAALYSAT